MNNLSFYIDDHALLYGLLCKYAEETCGDNGYKAAIQGTIRYAKERGLRMAMRAKRDGQPSTPLNYFLYKEWVDDRAWSKGELLSTTPAYQHKTLVCGWNETWKKYGLERYGALYCKYIDENLVKGYNPEMVLEIDAILTHGNPCCMFNWGDVGFSSEEDLKAMEAEAAMFAPERTKDFLYHTGHVLSALGATFLMAFGLDNGEKIIDAALGAYGEEMGEEKKAAIMEASQQNFLLV